MQLQKLLSVAMLALAACTGPSPESNDVALASDAGDTAALIADDATGDAAAADSNAADPTDASAVIASDAADAPPPCPAELAERGRCPNLSSYGLFVIRGHEAMPTEGNIAYDVISPLFSDSATKHRYLRLPAGGRIGWQPDGAWRFPIGTILSKTFEYPVDERNPSLGQRRIETRVLVRSAAGFVGATYVWNADQLDATLETVGASMPVSWIDRQGAPRAFGYRVPDMSQCTRCHGDDNHPLAVRTLQLDRDHDDGTGPANQIDAWARLGMFDSAPPPRSEHLRLTAPTDATAPLEQRARSYLESNCGHCHNSEGFARATGLFLGIEVTDASRLGACRTPHYTQDFGGRLYDIVPGSPEASVLVFRMAAEHDGERMPLGSQLADPVGLDVVSRWIAAMSPRVCP